MPKTLVIAEKPSVGRDLVRVLPGAFEKKGGKGEEFLEGADHVVTWAVGHLVQLADPDEYDEKFKKWRMADLPIVPDRFKLVVRDERSKKQMNVVKRLLGRDDVDQVVKGRLPQAGAPAVAELDDQVGHRGRVQGAAARR
jgi:DNA topoisomerase III